MGYLESKPAYAACHWGKYAQWAAQPALAHQAWQTKSSYSTAQEFKFFSSRQTYTFAYSNQRLDKQHKGFTRLSILKMTFKTSIDPHEKALPGVDKSELKNLIESPQSIPTRAL